MVARDCKLFIGGISSTVTRTDLEKEFGHHGRVTDVWVAQNPPGFAFVTFSTSRAANKALKALNGRTVFGDKLNVEVATSTGPRKPPRAPKFRGKRMRRDGLRLKTEDNETRKAKSAKMARASRLLASAKRTKARQAANKDKKSGRRRSSSQESGSPRSKIAKVSDAGIGEEGNVIRPLMEGFSPKVDGGPRGREDRGGRARDRKSGKRGKGNRRARLARERRLRRGQGANRPGRRRSLSPLSPRQGRGRRRLSGAGRWADSRNVGRDRLQSPPVHDVFGGRYRGLERGRPLEREWRRDRVSSSWGRQDHIPSLVPGMFSVRSSSPTTRQRLASATTALLRSTVSGRDPYIDSLMAEGGFHSRRDFLNTLQPLLPSLLAGTRYSQMDLLSSRSGREHSPGVRSWVGRERTPPSSYGLSSRALSPPPLMASLYPSSSSQLSSYRSRRSPPPLSSSSSRLDYLSSRDRSPLPRSTYSDSYSYRESSSSLRRAYSPDTSSLPRSYQADYKHAASKYSPLHKLAKSTPRRARSRSPAPKLQQQSRSRSPYRDDYTSKSHGSHNGKEERSSYSDTRGDRYEDQYSSSKRQPSVTHAKYSSPSRDRDRDRDQSHLPRSYRDPSPKSSAPRSRRPPSPPDPRPRTPPEPSPQTSGRPPSPPPQQYQSQDYPTVPKVRPAQLVLRHRSATPEEYIPRSKKLAQATRPRPRTPPQQQETVQPIQRLAKPKPVRYDFITARKRKAMISRNRPRN